MKGVGEVGNPIHIQEDVNKISDEKILLANFIEWVPAGFLNHFNLLIIFVYCHLMVVG